jgi:hypothetical protein
MKKAKNFSAQDIGEKKSFFENLKNVNEFVRQKTT